MRKFPIAPFRRSQTKFDTDGSMKVCILTYTAAWGGMELHTVGLANTLRKRGHEVVIVQLAHDCFSAFKGELIRGIELVSVSLPKPINRMTWFQWRQTMASFRADVCVFEKGELDSGSLSLDLAARASFLSYVTIEQLTCDPIPPRSSRQYFCGSVSGLGLWWYRLLLARHSRSLAPHRIVCVSEFGRRQLIEQYRFPPRKLVTIHNGFDASRFERNQHRGQEMRARWGIPETALLFGAVGRLSKIKGFDTAIELFRELTLRYPGRDMRLVLVGRGRAEEDFRRQAVEAGVGHRVIFPGFTDRPWEAYPAFDVFIMPSLNEGLPLALLEAMASGCPAIAMGVGGVPEVMPDPNFGWLVPPGNRKGFFEAMEAVVSQSVTALSEMGLKARHHVLSNFRSEDQFLKHGKLIENEYRLRKAGWLGVREGEYSRLV
jgi:glycosyltransferase involved in cell wall biosynthesis